MTTEIQTFTLHIARLHLWNRSDPVFGIDLGTVPYPVYTVLSQLNHKQPLASRDLTTHPILGVAVNAQLQSWSQYVLCFLLMIQPLVLHQDACHF